MSTVSAEAQPLRLSAAGGQRDLRKLHESNLSRFVRGMAWLRLLTKLRRAPSHFDGERLERAQVGDVSGIPARRGQLVAQRSRGRSTTLMSCAYS